MDNRCPSGGASVSAGMKRCPFLHNIAQKHGEDYATSLASGNSSGNRPLLAEDYDGNFSSTFALFHGQGGVLPLPHLSRPEPKVLYPLEPSASPMKEGESPRPACPFASGASISAPSAAAPFHTALPLASMSMSWGNNWFNIHHLFQQHLKQHRAPQRKPPQQPQQPKAQPSSTYGGVTGPGLGGPGSSGILGNSAGHAAGGKCPLRQKLGPLAGIVFNKNGHLTCPEPIIKMRAALAATRPVRELRPQALPIKLLTIAMTTAALNVPCGMWREHTKKFSSQWFVAVHATIPFIAMLRKAVIMPKYAILFTICAAIAGQTMGARLERKRLLSQAKSELGGLAKAVPAVAAPLPRPARTTQPPQPPSSSSSSRSPGRQMALASMLMSSKPLDRGASGAAAAAPVAVADGSLTAAMCAVEEAAKERVVQSQQAALQFRLRSGRRLGFRRDGVRVGRGGVVGPGAPVAAVLPAAVTC